ncbi:MAG: MgtC/SapB family protein, partial [Dehalococcoidia bacterium]
MSDAEQLAIFWQLMLALGCGAAVGIEREFRGHAAGVRTSALVCTGAALFGAISASQGDTRVAAAVVSGIGFIGAGLIFGQGGGFVRGVTTAATMWVLAGIGLMVSQGLALVAVLVTLA